MVHITPPAEISRDLTVLWEKLKGTYISVALPFIDLCEGNLYRAFILNQIIYWFSPGKNGQPRVRVKKNGYLWLAKTYTDWGAECRVKPETARKAISWLRDHGYIQTKVHRFNGLTTVHIRPIWENLVPALLNVVAPESFSGIKPDRPLVSNRSEPSDQSGSIPEGNPLTKPSPEPSSKSLDTTTDHPQAAAPVCVENSSPRQEDSASRDGVKGTISPPNVTT